MKDNLVVTFAAMSAMAALSAFYDEIVNMKKIDDAPKELQKVFAILWEESNIPCEYKTDAVLLFLKGFDTAMATGGLPQKAKREIKTVISDAENVYALSSDGKLYLLLADARWFAYPDLPQD